MPQLGVGLDIPKIIINDNAHYSIWKTNNPGISANNQITLPTEITGTYNCTIYWDDGTSNIINAWNDPNLTHTYLVAGTYKIKIVGQFEGFRFNGGGDCKKLISIINGGVDFRLGNNNGYFYGCSNLLITDGLITTGMTNFYYMYRDCTLFNGELNLDSESVSQFYAMLYNCINFNREFKLNTANATNLSYLLNGATSFNKKLTDIDIGKVTTMTFMMNNATSWSNQNYSDALVAWQSKPHLLNVPFRCSSKYLPYALAARTALQADGWIITDLGAA